jgi:hypothetical protein
LPEDEQTSKQGGGGRYDAILEFKRGVNKKIYEKEKETKMSEEKRKERKKEKYEKKKKYEYV